MVNFTAFITLLMGFTTFVADNIPGVHVFSSLSQRLLAAPPPQSFFADDGTFTVTHGRYEESFTVIQPTTVTTTFTFTAGTTTTTATAFTTTTQTFTTTTASPGTELALFTGTLSSPSILSLAKEFVCAIFTVPAPLTANAASVDTAFLFGALLLVAYTGFLASAPPVMKPEDLLWLEEQLLKKGELLEGLRYAYDVDRADLRRRLQVQGEWASKHLAATITQHRSDMADKDREIFVLRQKLAGADLREEQARFKSSDEVLKMHKEIGHLRSVIDNLDQEFEVTGALAALTEEAQEKVKDAEERALAAAQQALEANQKVEAAVKAHKEKITAERVNAQAAIDKVVDQAGKLKDKVRVKEYEVQDLEALVKKLKAEAVGAAPVLMPTILGGKSSATVGEKMRDRIQTAVNSASGTPLVPVPVPAVAPPAAAAAPEPLAPGQQKRIPRRPTVGPFPDLHKGKGRKK
jgi:hypothetical protein